MHDNPLLQLQNFGQSVWLDSLSRTMLRSGELEQLISRDGIRGVTSNPAIFNKAIGGSNAYDEEIERLGREGKSVAAIYEKITVADVRRTADLFRRVFEASAGEHGFVSLEVNPHLARDTGGTVAEARRLWRALDRPNVFIKVPATVEGLAAIEQLIGEGINVNVTLLFSLPRYRQVIEAYMAGLERRSAAGQPPQVRSVASFFLSRIDVLVDSWLEALRRKGGVRAQEAADLLGEAAIASAKQAYQMYREISGSERFRALAAEGAWPQRLLWASTGTKNPAYPDVKYVEPLIGSPTVNTMPLQTLEAYRDHGRPAARLEEEVEKSGQVVRRLAGLGIELETAADQLEEEGIEKFNKPYDESMATLRAKNAALVAS